MLRKTMTFLAMAAALAAGLTADAAAGATAHSGWDGLGDGGGHAIVLTPVREQHPPRLQRRERRYDRWGHDPLDRVGRQICQGCDAFNNTNISNTAFGVERLRR